MGERRPWLSKALGHLEGLPHVPGWDWESVVVGMRGWEPRQGGESVGVSRVERGREIIRGGDQIWGNTRNPPCNNNNTAAGGVGSR